MSVFDRSSLMLLGFVLASSGGSTDGRGYARLSSMTYGDRRHPKKLFQNPKLICTETQRKSQQIQVNACRTGRK
jgi:hypothetical protein